MSENYTVYSAPNCVACTEAKRLLTLEGLSFNTIDITSTPEAKEVLVNLQVRTVPQVFHGEHFIGDITAFRTHMQARTKELS